MKRIILISSLAILFLNLSAQMDFGIKGGLNISNVKASEILTDDYRINPAASGNLGYHVGGFFRASLLGIFIQPELYFSSLSSEFKVEDLSGTGTAEQLVKQKIGRIDVPVLVGVKLGTFRLGLGPVGSIIVSDQSDLDDITGYEATLKSATFGYQIGAGVDIWKIGIDLRYEGNLTKLGDHLDIGGQTINLDNRVRQIIISLGISF
ncbi:MAG: PorT family protein [Bacteroidales bacterium]|nr:PorT family protein [Bacteroidales bacterium]